MPRANRHHIPGQIWHITHRCHQREFLFKFAKDRKRWLQWLFEAKKRYGLSILNYIVTSNHIHLLVVDDESDAISKSLQLIAGRSAQEFNQRKNRKGAYWEDRYHATAIERGEHLLRCLVYIDMNMVRAGVVSHPSKWIHSGYHEIQTPPLRYALIDRSKLVELSGAASDEQLKSMHHEWVESAIQENQRKRQPAWSEAVAIGSVGFVERMKQEMGYKAVGRKPMQTDDACMLREPDSSYIHYFDVEKAGLGAENSVYLDINAGESIC